MDILSFIFNLIVFLFTAIIILLSYLKFWKSRTKLLLEKIPCPDHHFFFGHALHFLCPREEWFKKAIAFTKDFQPVSVIWSGRNPRITLMRARAAEKLLSTTHSLDKANEYQYLVPWLGFGLLTSTGAKWHSRRKLITPTFHFRILEDFLAIINEHANILVDTLNEHSNETPFDIYPYLTRCTLDVICETAMGKKIGCQQQSDLGVKYFKAVNSMGELFSYRCIYPWLRPNWLFRWTSYAKKWEKNLNLLHGFTTKVIQERREALKLKNEYSNGDREGIFGSKRRLAFLDMLLDWSSEDGKVLTDEDIREECDTFMFEGHDTTSSGLVWTLYAIGQHPEIQKKIHEELDELFGDSERAINWTDLNELKYLERVIKESLRLFPPVPFFGRTLSEDLKICGYVCPKGVSVSVNTFTLHRDPEFFPDPEKFDPDRFLTENCTKRHPYAYVPFSAGPRNCIGQKFALMEEKVITCAIMRKYEIKSMHNFEDINVIGELVLRPANGMWLSFKKRK